MVLGKRSQFSLLGFVAVVIAFGGVVLFLLCYSKTRSGVVASQQSLDFGVGNSARYGEWFRVDGPSMAPTLFGSCRQWSCHGCGETNFSFVLNREGDAASKTACSVCGLIVEVADIQAEYPGDRVNASLFSSTDPQSREHLERGALVIVSNETGLHVKRLVGLPGDTIGLKGVHLTINGVRIEDALVEHPIRFSLPWLLVSGDRSAGKVQSSVVASKERSSREVNRRVSEVWVAQGDSKDKMIFSPGTLDPQGVSSPVWDDFTFNIGISRRLFSVDRLRVSGIALDTTDLRVYFWTEEGVRCVDRSLREGEWFQVSCFEGTLAFQDENVFVVDQEHPIALISSVQASAVTDLAVERLLEYRIRPQDRMMYPLLLRAGEYFVLGDNVPLSVDSRNWGPLGRQEIKGQVECLQRDL